MRDQPFPREHYVSYWTVLMPDGKERGKYDSEQRADDEARELMYDQYDQLEIAKVLVTTGGTFLNWGIEITESKILHNETH